MKYLVMRLTGIEKFSFSEDEIETACYLLHHFLAALKDDNPTVESLKNLMLEMSKYMRINLETKLKLTDINTPIEHHLQSEHTQTRSFEALTRTS